MHTNHKNVICVHIISNGLSQVPNQFIYGVVLKQNKQTRAEGMNHPAHALPNHSTIQLHELACLELNIR